MLLGEKCSDSAQFYLLLTSDVERSLADLAESRHGGAGPAAAKSGSSNYAFADGGVRSLRYGTSLCPVNLWALTEEGRASYAVCRSH